MPKVRYTYRRGLLRCSFNYDGQCEGLRAWDGWWYDSHAFFVYVLWTGFVIKGVDLLYCLRNWMNMLQTLLWKEEMRLRRDGTLSIATSEIFFGICKARRGFTVWQRAMPAPICSNIHRINEVTNNSQQLLVEGFSFYAVAEISTTHWKRLLRTTKRYMCV